MDNDNSPVKLWINPDFKHVLVFFGLHAVTFQTKDRVKAKAFAETMKQLLLQEAITISAWPYKEPVMVAIFICGPSKNYARQDVDNMTKLILDSCKGIIFNDDRQVEILVVQKRIWDKPSFGFQLGIRLPETEKADIYTPMLWYIGKSTQIDPRSPKQIDPGLPF